MNIINIGNYKAFRDYAYEHLINSDTWSQALVDAGYPSATDAVLDNEWCIQLDDKDYFLFVLRWSS